MSEHHGSDCRCADCIDLENRVGSSAVSGDASKPSDVPLYAFEEWARTQPGFGTAGNAPDYRIGAVRTALTAWHAALASQASLAKRGTEPSDPLENIESSFNACMHREHCKGWKRAAESAPSEKLSVAEALGRLYEMGVQDGRDYQEEYAEQRKATAINTALTSHAETVPHAPAGQGECPACDGTGDMFGGFACDECGGTGRASMQAEAPQAPICSGCNGNGEVGGLRSDGHHSEECPFCKGTGRDEAPQATKDAEDAARYRWLRENKCVIESAIDAARKSQGEAP